MFAYLRVPDAIYFYYTFYIFCLRKYFLVDKVRKLTCIDGGLYHLGLLYGCGRSRCGHHDERVGEAGVRLARAQCAVGARVRRPTALHRTRLARLPYTATT